MVLAALAGAIWLLAMQNAGLAGGVAAKGQAIAAAHCSRCHIVSDKDRFKGISSTPSFMILVNALADWQERFQTFYARRPHPAHVIVEGLTPPTGEPHSVVPVQIKPQDVDDIVAFAQSLKKDR